MSPQGNELQNMTTLPILATDIPQATVQQDDYEDIDNFLLMNKITKDSAKVQSLAPASLIVPSPKGALPSYKKPLPLPLQHSYEEDKKAMSVTSTETDAFCKPRLKPTKSTETTDKSLKSTNFNGNEEKLIEMEDKIGNILSRLSRLEGDMSLLKSKCLDAEPVPLVVHKDTSTAQVCELTHYMNRVGSTIFLSKNSGSFSIDRTHFHSYIAYVTVYLPSNTLQNLGD